MAQTTQTGGIPLDEYTKSVPPGWREDVDNYPFRTYLEKLRLWNRITDVNDNDKGATIVGRLKSDAYKTAMATKIQRVQNLEDPGRPGVFNLRVATLTGDDAICSPASDAVLGEGGVLLLPAQVSGVRAMLETLRGEYVLHEHDEATVKLEDVFEFSQGKQTLLQGIRSLDKSLDDAEEKAGLGMNNVGRSHLLLSRLNIPEKLADGIRLKVDGDMSRYNDIKSLIRRIAKRQQASASGSAHGGHYTGDFADWAVSSDGMQWMYRGEPCGEYHADPQLQPSPSDQGNGAYHEESDGGWFEEYSDGVWHDVDSSDSPLMEVLYGMHNKGKGKGKGRYQPFQYQRRTFRWRPGFKGRGKGFGKGYGKFNKGKGKYKFKGKGKRRFKGGYWSDDGYWWDQDMDSGEWFYYDGWTEGDGGEWYASPDWSPQWNATPSTADQTQQWAPQAEDYNAEAYKGWKGKYKPYKGGGKDKGECTRCGSKWHSTADCPIPDNGQGKGSHFSQNQTMSYGYGTPWSYDQSLSPYTAQFMVSSVEKKTTSSISSSGFDLEGDLNAIVSTLPELPRFNISRPEDVPSSRYGTTTSSSSPDSFVTERSWSLVGESETLSPKEEKTPTTRVPLRGDAPIFVPSSQQRWSDLMNQDDDGPFDTNPTQEVTQGLLSSEGSGLTASERFNDWLTMDASPPRSRSPMHTKPASQSQGNFIGAGNSPTPLNKISEEPTTAGSGTRSNLRCDHCHTCLSEYIESTNDLGSVVRTYICDICDGGPTSNCDKCTSFQKVKFVTFLGCNHKSRICERCIGESQECLTCGVHMAVSIGDQAVTPTTSTIGQRQSASDFLGPFTGRVRTSDASMEDSASHWLNSEDSHKVSQHSRNKMKTYDTSFLDEPKVKEQDHAGDDKPEKTVNDYKAIFLSANKQTHKAIRTFFESAGYHTVRGRKVYGLIVDPGAAHALMGSDTLLEFIRATGVPVMYRRTDRTFVGIGGEPSEGLSKANFPLGIPELNAVFDTDLIGGSGSKFPGLLPLYTMRKNRCALLCGFFGNDDGLLVVTVNKGSGPEWIGLRVLLTDSEHYILPCDDYTKKISDDRRKCSLLASQVMKELYERFNYMRYGPDERTTLQNETAKCDQSKVNASHLTSATDVIHVWKATAYERDQVPSHLPEKERKRLKILYKYLPERYYTESKVPVVTPDNVESYISHYAKDGLQWDLQELFSGSALFTGTGFEKGLKTGFPVDYRYGWDLALEAHQALVTKCDEIFQPKVCMFHLDLSNWTNGSRRQDESTISLARNKDEQLHQWLVQYSQRVASQGRKFLSLTAANSQVHKKGTVLKKLSEIPGYQEPQITTLCSWNLKNAKGQFVERRTRIDSNISLRTCIHLCTGHGNESHGSPLSIKMKTDDTITLPKAWILSMLADLWTCFESDNDNAYWSCKRCKFGTKTEDPHTYEEGKCRLAKADRPATSLLPKVLKPGEPVNKYQDPPPKKITTEAEKKMSKAISAKDMTVEDLQKKISNVSLLWPRRPGNEKTDELKIGILSVLGEHTDLLPGSSRWVLVENGLSAATKLLLDAVGKDIKVELLQVAREPKSWRTPMPQRKLAELPYRMSIIGYTVFEWEGLPIQNLLVMKEQFLHSRISGDPEWLITLFCSSYENKLDQEMMKNSGKLLQHKRQDPRFRGGETIRPNYDLRQLAQKLWKGDRSTRKSLLKGAHERLWHSPAEQMRLMIRRIHGPEECLDLCYEIVRECAACADWQRPPRRPTVKVEFIGHFGEVVQWDLFFLWDIIFLMMIDVAIKWKLAQDIPDKTGKSILLAMMIFWFRYFGPPRVLESDQEGGATSGYFTRETERLSITLRFKGSQGHTGTGLAERHIQLTEVAALKTWEDVKKHGLRDIEKKDVVIECAGGQNTLLEYGGSSPNQALLGSNPRGFYEVECQTELGNSGASEATPDVIEQTIRMRHLAKYNILRSVWESRLAKAHRSRPMQQSLGDFKPKETAVDLYRVPERKDESGWRGPCVLLDVDADEGTAVVKSQGLPYIVPLRHIRKHLAYFLRLIFHYKWQSNIYHAQLQSIHHSDSVMKAWYEDLFQTLIHLMDYVDGCTQHKVFINGKLRNDQGVDIYIPQENEKEPTPLLKIGMRIADQVLKIGPIDGIRYGTALKHYNAFHNCRYALMLIWKRFDRADHSTWEVNPSRTTQLQRFVQHEWDGSSSIMFYNLSKVIEDLNKPVEIPSLDDLDISTIPDDGGDDMKPDDESMPPWYSSHDDDMLDPSIGPDSGNSGQQPGNDDDQNNEQSRSRSRIRRPAQQVPKNKILEEQPVSIQVDDETLDYSQNTTQEDAQNSSNERSRSRTKKGPTLPEKDDEISRNKSNQDISVDDISFKDPQESIDKDLERTRSPRKKPEKEIKNEPADVQEKKRKLEESSDSIRPHPQARGSQDPAPLLPTTDDSFGSPPRHPPDFSVLPEEPAARSPAKNPEPAPTPNISVNEESTQEYQDPDETVEYYGSYPVVTELLRNRKKTRMHTVNHHEVLDDDYMKACVAMHREYYAAQNEAMKDEIKQSKCLWTKSEADFVIPGPWLESRCFYLDVRTGECIIPEEAFHTQEDLTEEEIVKHWTTVEKADRAEVKQFVDEKVFKKKYYYDVNIDVIDAIWIRKWKQLADGTIIVKSRLCVRGFLDPQRSAIPTRSTTASRLSHRIFMSLCALLQFEIESWDISGAFLKGFTFAQLDQLYKSLGISAPKRQVIVKPPANVWRYLREIPNSGIWVADSEIMFWLLELIKAMYGLNDAPFAFQACEGKFFVEELSALRSKFDENFYYWLAGPGSVSALATAHVDDNEIGTPRTPEGSEWKEDAHGKFEKKFGKVKRVKMPLKHCGVRYTETVTGYKMDQDEYCQQAKPMDIEPSRMKEVESYLTPPEMTLFRGVLGALLWLCITNLKVMTDVVLLQQELTRAKIKHAIAANKVLTDIKKYGENVGLYFPFLRPPLNLVSIHDACGAKEQTSYAQEGQIVILKEDRPLSIDAKTHEVHRSSLQLLGGFCHVMHGSSKKAKRVGVSTSRKETVSAVGCQEICQLIAIRYTEILGSGFNLPLYRSPTTRELLDVQESGGYCFPIDDYGDCKDVWELMTGVKGVPQDRHQRLYILSLREDRMTGRIRNTVHVPTEIMVADSLTKKMLSSQFMNLITTGYLYMVTDKKVLCRCRVRQDTYTEQELVDMDG